MSIHTVLTFLFLCFFFFFNDTATTEIYTLSLHDALPISSRAPSPLDPRATTLRLARPAGPTPGTGIDRLSGTSLRVGPPPLASALALEVEAPERRDRHGNRPGTGVRLDGEGLDSAQAAPPAPPYHVAS